MLLKAMQMTLDNNAIKHNIDKIRLDINSISGGRNIVLIAVTKTVPYKDVLFAVESGIEDIAESKIQEALPKFEQLGSINARKHFIGHLQSNKAKKAVEHFDLIQSLDNLNLAYQIDKHAANLGKIQKCLIQIKLSSEPTKTGLEPQEFEGFYEALQKLEHLQVEGLMVVAPNSDNIDDSKLCFDKAYEIFSKYENSVFSTLSMGMSEDYEIAIKSGANMVRIGSAIFGARIYANK
jgi:pyridoxal phosphate enzyme (YggS family)